MFFKKPDQLKPQNSAGQLNREPLTIRIMKNRSQEFLNVVNQPNKEPTPQIQPKKWTLKKLLNIVDQQQQAICTSRFFHLNKKPSRASSKDQSKDKSQVVIEEKFIEEKVGDSARIRLVKFLSFHRAGSIEQTKLNISQGSVRKLDHKPAMKLQINTSKFQNSQLIKQLSSTDRRVILSYSKQTTRRRNYKAIAKLRRIFRQVIDVARYIQKNKLWFCYPITYNRTFLQKIIDKQFEQVKNELHTDPQLVHIRNQHGQTPLHLACISNNFSLIKLLIQYQSCLEALDCQELTPLHYAIQQNSAICIKLLLDSNAQPWSPPGQRIFTLKLSCLIRDMINEARIRFIIRLWKREVKIKNIVKQFTSKK